MNDNVALNFILTQSEADIEKIYNFNVDVFAESPDVNWDKNALKSQLKEGWNIFSVKYGEEIVAAALLKKDHARLLTQNTPIKMTYQGNGFSHQIKEFFEEEAKKLKLNEVVSLCSESNFRMISLNETHGYTKTGNRYNENNNLVEWVKPLK